MRGITPQGRLEKWNEAICAQKASGLTIKDWCEQNGISPRESFHEAVPSLFLSKW